jgi:isoleucyl-tRNA synthetase
VSDHLSNWYVRLSRRRFWNPSAGESQRKDKHVAYETLGYCLTVVSQLMAPIAPFYADWLYRNLTHTSDDNSVHLTDFPVAEQTWINKDLENSMDLAQRISSMIHGIRKNNKIKVRQPLSKILVPVLNQTTRDQISSVEELIKTEVNVKEVSYLDDASGVLSKKVKPNFKALGPKYGKNMKAVADLILGLDKEQIKEIETHGKLSFEIGEIELSDLEILTEDLPGYLTAQDGGLTVALDIHIDDALKQEGIARDFVNRVQNYRKDNGFEVTDKIVIELENDQEELSTAVQNFSAYICQEVQATSLEIKNGLKETAEIEMDEFILKIKIFVFS